MERAGLEAIIIGVELCSKESGATHEQVAPSAREVQDALPDAPWQSLWLPQAAALHCWSGFRLLGQPVSDPLA